MAIKVSKRDDLVPNLKVLELTADLLDDELQSAGDLRLLSDEDLLTVTCALEQVIRRAVAETHRRVEEDPEEPGPGKLFAFNPAGDLEEVSPEAAPEAAPEPAPRPEPLRRFFSDDAVRALLAAMPGQPRDVATAIIYRWSAGGTARNVRESAIFMACAILADMMDQHAGTAGAGAKTAEALERITREVNGAAL